MDVISVTFILLLAFHNQEPYGTRVFIMPQNIECDDLGAAISQHWKEEDKEVTGVTWDCPKYNIKVPAHAPEA